jgi:hypothetical protein
LSILSRIGRISKGGERKKETQAYPKEVQYEISKHEVGPLLLVKQVDTLMINKNMQMCKRKEERDGISRLGDRVGRYSDEEAISVKVDIHQRIGA